MGSNRTPIDKSMTKQQAISQGGYYNTDGDWNNITTLDEYPGKVLRGRVEVLILKDSKIFMLIKDSGYYRIPGGGFDRGVLNKDQVFIETKEEAKLIIENIRFTGVTYVDIYDEIWSSSQDEIPYDGTYNEVYIANFKDTYDGYIRKRLSDKELTSQGQFYDIDTVKNILKEPHKQALENMLNNVMTESTTSDSDLILTAQQFQKVLNNLHNKENSYMCINPVEIESDDGGFVFAEYHTNSANEIDEVKRFVKYCNGLVKTTIYRGYVEEPETYTHGFLYIKYEPYNESSYLIDENCIDTNKEFFLEAASNNKYPIFIVNAYTGTPFGKIIKAYTHSEYTHSAISLDTSLENLFSFNGDNGVNKWGGFSKEALSSYCKYNKECKIKVDCIFVNKISFENIKNKLNYLIENQRNTKYGFDNLFNIISNKSVEMGKDVTSMICSQFVSYILSIADIKLLDKSINLVTPKDLASVSNPRIYHVYEGLGSNYDKKKIDRIFNKLKAKAELINK